MFWSMASNTRSASAAGTTSTEFLSTTGLSVAFLHLHGTHGAHNAIAVRMVSGVHTGDRKVPAQEPRSPQQHNADYKPSRQPSPSMYQAAPLFQAAAPHPKGPAPRRDGRDSVGVGFTGLSTSPMD